MDETEQEEKDDAVELLANLAHANNVQVAWQKVDLFYGFCQRMGTE